MKLYQVEVNRPDAYSSDYESLADYELENLPEFKIGWYWYASGSYEGQGQLLVNKDEKWYLNSLEHCSCYGPTGCLDFHEENAFDSLDKIQDKLYSDYYFKEVLPLINAAREAGFE